MASKVDQKKLSGNNLLIVLALVTLLVVGITALAAKAMIADIFLNNKVLTAKNTADGNLKTDLDAAPKLVDAYHALGSQAGVLADALPVTSDFPALIVEMENITNDSGVFLKTVGPDTLGGLSGGVTPALSTPTAGSASGSTAKDDLAAPPAQPYNFTLDLDGNYANLLKLLNDLETSARPMRVTSLQMTGGATDLHTSLTVTTYYMDKAKLPIGTETVK